MQSDLKRNDVKIGPSGEVYLRPFDATDDDFVPPPVLSLSGLSGVEFATQPGVVIEAPSGPMRIATGYFVYAAVLDAHGGVVRGQRIGDGGLRFGVASGFAMAAAERPGGPPGVLFDATHVIVNDGAGETIEKHEVRRVAA